MLSGIKDYTQTPHNSPLTKLSKLKSAVLKHGANAMKEVVKDKCFLKDNVRYLVDVHEEATAVPFGYLIIDARPETPTNLRLRSEIFLDKIYLA